MDNYTTYTEQLREWSEKGENMWQRIKNWIIRKLGGYTEADLTATLNLHNTVCYYAQNKLQPVELAKGIKAYCKEHDRCAVCGFGGLDGCKLTDTVPCCWEI